MSPLSANEGGTDEKDAVRALERPVQHLLVVDGALHDLGFATNLRGKFGRVARDDPQRGVGGQEIFQYLRTNVSRGSSEDDHDVNYTVPFTLQRKKKPAPMRGDKLSEHILQVAKDVFLEIGFERASMDVIAARAETSKRTLYAHFENKEKLYLKVIDMVRGLVVSKLKMPGDYPGKPPAALVQFCGRFLEILLYARTIRMCRLSIAEAARFPEGSARYFDVIMSVPHERLSAYLKETFHLSAEASAQGGATFAWPDCPSAFCARVVRPG